jgi:SAM-dependent methyltransferase
MSPPRSIPAFQQVDRRSVHQPHRKHPYAYHIRCLEAAVRRLSRELDLAEGSRVLDYGCAEMPYRRLFGPGIQYVGADLAGNPVAELVLRPDGSLPLGDGQVDAVISTQVLEHAEDPQLYLKEAWRVLKPGGRLLLSTHGIFAYHPDPVDLWRWTGEGLRKAVTDAGFEVMRLEGVVGLASTGLQLVQDAISYRIPKRWLSKLALLAQPIVAFADRFETSQSLSYNAQVFALVGEKRL